MLNSTTKHLSSFEELYTHLTTRYATPVLPLSSSKPHIAPQSIASLSLHPTLEILLHILNNDLPSAHFLVRHMQSPPAYEGMYLHGMLHRIEGDYRNADAWYSDVERSEIFDHVWGEEGKLEACKKFVKSVERLKKEREGELEILEEASEREFVRVAEWCKEKYGTGKWDDCSGEWVKDDGKIKEAKEKQLVGGEGWRKF